MIGPVDAEDLLPEDPSARRWITAEAHALFERVVGQAEAKRLAPVFEALFGPCAPTREAWQTAPKVPKSLALSALLALPPASTSANFNALQDLRAWVLLCALDATASAQADHSTWRFAARAVRRVCTRADLEDARLRSGLSAGKNLRDARKRTEAWIQREEDAGSTFAARLEDVARALAQLDGRARRQIRARGAREKSGTDVARALFAQEVSGARSALRRPRQASFDLAVPADFDTGHNDLLSVEEVADVVVPTVLCFVSDDPVLIDDEREAEAELESFADLSAGSAVLASGQLTREEAQAVASDLRTAMGVQPTPGTVLLAASLFTGRSIPQLCQAQLCVPRAAGQDWWHRDRRGGLIGLAYTAAVTDAPTPPERGVAMALPDWLHAPLAEVLETGQPDPDAALAQARTWLSGRTHGRRQRTSRLAVALKSGLAALGVDDVITAHLAGEDPPHVPAMYYARVPIDTLDRAWQDWQQNWLGQQGTAPGVLATSDDAHVGSRRVPDDMVIARLFTERVADMAAAQRRQERGDPIAGPEIHASFVTHAALALALALGARPHGSVCPPLSSMVAEGPGPCVVIGDKGNRSVDDSRWLPLPRLARSTMAAIRAQLRHVEAWGLALNPQVARTARAALAGEIPPLWFLSLQGAPEPLAAKQLWSRIPLHGAPRNIFRHYWRTAFLEAGLPGWAADQWMGHGGWQSAQYLPTAGTRQGDLAMVADLIDTRIDALKIAAPSPRKLLP